MRRVVFLSLILLVGILSFSQVSVRISSQMLPPGAPFRVMINSDLTGITSIVATFDGTSLNRSKVPAFFTFYAPKLLNRRAKDVTVHITIHTKSGEYSKSVVIRVSNNANPVIIMENPIPSNGNYIKGTVKFPVKVYGGLGLTNIQFMVDSRVASSISVNSSKPLGVFERTFKINTATISNTWHTFSVKIVNVTGQIFSKIKAYIVDNSPPLIKIQKFGTCLAAGRRITVKVTAISTVSGIAEVKINNATASRVSKTVWEAQLRVPKETESWIVHAVAVDNATNKASEMVKVFVDGETPTIRLSNDAKITDKIDGKIILWKRTPPLTFTISATAASEHCGIKPSMKVEIVNAERKIVYSYSGIVNGSIAVPLALPGTYKISVTATDRVNELSSSIDKKYTEYIVKFDNKAPIIKKFIVFPNKFKNKDGYDVIAPTSTLTVTITATDGTGVGLKNITISPVKAVGKGNTRTFSIAQLKPGRNPYPLKITLWDKLNNSTTISTTLKICVDDASPTLSVTPKASLLHNGIYWNKTHPLILSVKSMTMCDVLPVVIVKANNKEVFSGKATSIDVDLTELGNNSVYIISTNPVNGKTNTLRKTYMVGFDNTPPTIESITLPATKGPSQSATVIVKVTDTGIGIKSVKVNDVKATYSNGKYQAVLKTPELSKSGYWTVKVVAKDWLGNQSQKDKKIYIDARSPQITCSLFPNNHYRNGTYWTKGGRSYVPFYIKVVVKTDSGVEPIATCTLKKDQPESSPSMIFNGGATLVTKSGVYTLKCEALNPINGKSTECAKEYRLGFDGTPPVISNVTLPATVGPDQNFKVTAKVVDSGGGVKYVSVNNKLMERIAPHSDLWSKTLIAPSSFKRSRNFNVTISAIDVFGNKRTLSRKVFVDVNPPKVTLYLVSSNGKKVRVNPNGVYYFKTNPVLEYVALTDGKVKPETKMYKDWIEKPISNDETISGTHFIKVVSTNTTNGKVTTVKVGFSVVVDSIPPKLNIKVPNVVNTSSSANIKFSIEDEYLKYGYLVVKSENGAILYSHAYDKSGTNIVNLRRAFSGINGKNISIELSAVDLAGNPSTANKKYIYVDTVPPYIRNVNITKDGVVIITMSESVQGKPEVVLISSNGKEKLTGSGEVSDNEVIVNQFIGGKIQRNKIYKVEIKNVTDKAGNTIGNNFTNWAF